MKKFFFFKSSSSNGSSGNSVPRQATDKQLNWGKPSDSTMRNQANDQSEHDFNCSNGNFFKSLKEAADARGSALRRSRSLSSAAFLVDGFGETYSNDPRRSPCSTSNNQHRQNSRSSRCLTPDRRSRGRQFEAEYNHIHEGKTLHDSSGSSSSCSSNVVVDRYIDGEEHIERSKQKSSSSNRSIYGNSKGRRFPPRAQCTAPMSPLDSVKDKVNSHSFREAKGTRLHFPSTDCVENGFRYESPRRLAKSVIERLSQNHRKSKALNHEPITIRDVYGSLDKTSESNSNITAIKNVPQVEHFESLSEYHGDDHLAYQQSCLRGKESWGLNYVGAEEDDDIELERRLKEAEKRAMLLSEEVGQQRSLSNCGFDVLSLVEAVRNLEEERVRLAFEISSLLQSRVIERASAREEIRLAKAELDLHTQRLEKEKNELQAGLEKELDRRSSDWSFKLEKYQLEEKRLRERVRELAEQNVSLQREVSTFHERETENREMITYLDRKVKDLSTKAEEVHEDNSNLTQSLSKLQESYTGTTEDLDCLRRNYEEKDKECSQLQKSVTRLLRTCKEQEKTIEGLRDGQSEVIRKQPCEKSEEMVKKLQMEQIRLTGVELSLRREVESMKLEAESLRQENIRLLDRLKGNGKEIEVSTFKLDSEMKMRVCYLQDQGLSMLNESTQMCLKLLKFIKGKFAQFPDTHRDTPSISSGLDEQFILESEMRVHGVRRGMENLKRSLQTVSTLLASKSESPCQSSERTKELNNQTLAESLRAELRAETLVTSLLREKMYSKEQEVEQLHSELATAVRGNEILRCEVQSTLDNLSVNTYQLKDLELQMIKKDQDITRLEFNLQEASKELAIMKGLLPKVSEERDMIWAELKQYSEKNMLLNSENDVLKKKIEGLDEDILLKEGQITILKDTLENKHFDLLSSPDFSKYFLVE